MNTVQVGVRIDFDDGTTQAIRIRVDADKLTKEVVMKELSDTMFYWAKGYAQDAQVSFGVGEYE